jgi:hypothetical protein
MLFIGSLKTWFVTERSVASSCVHGRGYVLFIGSLKTWFVTERGVASSCVHGRGHVLFIGIKYAVSRYGVVWL